MDGGSQFEFECKPTKFSLQNISAFWTLNTPSLLHQVEEKISREVLGKVFDMWFEDQLVLS